MKGRKGMRERHGDIRSARGGRLHTGAKLPKSKNKQKEQNVHNKWETCLL